jgi:hypothetical protein
MFWGCYMPLGQFLQKLDTLQATSHQMKRLKYKMLVLSAFTIIHDFVRTGKFADPAP